MSNFFLSDLGLLVSILRELKFTLINGFSQLLNTVSFPLMVLLHRQAGPASIGKSRDLEVFT